MKLALVSCPPEGLDFPHYGIAYLISYLKEYTVRFFDVNSRVYQRSPQHLKRQWQSEHFSLEAYQYTFDAVAHNILSSSPEYTAFSVNKLNLQFSLEIASRLKGRTKLIMGGPGIAYDWERKRLYNRKLIDYFILGTGEKELAAALSGKRTSNMCCLDDSRYIETRREKRDPSNHIITYDHCDLSRYNTLPLLLNKGCIGKCTFCSDRIILDSSYSFSPDKIFSEIEYHSAKFGIRSYEFNDLAININLPNLTRLCQRIISSGLSITWSANCIPLDMDYGLLRKAGCDTLRFGIETGSQKILRAMRKPTTLEQASKALQKATKAGIKTSINLIVGYPGETGEDFLETLHYIKTNKENIYSVCNLSTCIITPQSTLEVRQKELCLYFPEEHWKNWCSGENTPELRQRRLIEAERFIRQADIPIINVNAY